MSKRIKHELRVEETIGTWDTGEYLVLVDDVVLGKACSVEEVIFLVRMHYPKSNLSDVTGVIKGLFNEAE